ncbi:nitroreductase family protein [candidate division KSB1 bacterium]
MQNLTGEELLTKRRSVRDFKNEDVPEKTLEQIFEICRYAPTSMNSQSYYFRIIKDKEILEWLSPLRGKSSSPIGRAPMAVAICSNPDKSKRHEQDGCIAAYHFILACCNFGIGTCWIAAMNREDVKEMLGIPENHYIATITPVGYPAKLFIEAPKREGLVYYIRKDPKCP